MGVDVSFGSEIAEREGSGEMEGVAVWGKYLQVENVQEMVKKDPSAIPEIYVREEKDKPSVGDDSPLTSEIPVIDFSALISGEECELRKLDKACQDWGFFQIINHGIQEEVLQKVNKGAADFFGLPLEEKNKYEIGSDDVQGYGQIHVVSEDQTLDWGDALILHMFPSKLRKLKFWPTTPLGFKEAIEVYSAEVSKIAEQLIGSISLLLGMNKDRLLSLHEEVIEMLRINYYPSCSRPDQVLGVSPHSDSSTITILLQDEDVTGLQIRHNGSWLPVKPIPNALVVNLGDALEIWSNGRYESIEHRAITNEHKARISLATFVYPHASAEIEPLESQLDGQQCKKLYKKMSHGEFLKNKMMQKMDGKAHLEFAKIQYD